MKRNSAVKKLALSRETLRSLNEKALSGAAAGSRLTHSCNWTECDSCGIICSVPIQTCTC